MLPDWITEEELYTPLKDNSAFVRRTLKSMGEALSRLRVQRGHEKGDAIPGIVKLVGVVALIVMISVFQNRLFLLGVAAFLNGYLAFWPPKDIPKILKPALFAALLAFILFLPAMIMNPAGIYNNLRVVAKVFLSVEALNIFNHTTTWHHITGAMRKLKLPGLFIFTFDITLKYIVLLGNLISDMLTALTKRSVGKNNKKYSSVGGIMGTTFIRSTEMSKEMYEAMECRGFTGEY